MLAVGSETNLFWSSHRSKWNILLNKNSHFNGFTHQIGFKNRTGIQNHSWLLATVAVRADGGTNHCQNLNSIQLGVGVNFTPCWWFVHLPKDQSLTEPYNLITA